MTELPHNPEFSDDSEYDYTPEGVLGWAVAEACLEIFEDLGIASDTDDAQEALDMIRGANSPEEALTTVISACEGLDIPYEVIFPYLAQKGIITDFET